MTSALAARFWPKVERRANFQCWPWRGSKVGGGYGQIRLGGRGTPFRPAMVVAYELLISPWPAGMRARHVCRNNSCVNPWHAQPSTPADAVRPFSPYCKRGHRREGRNVYRDPRGHRRCRVCILEARRQRAEWRRGAA